MNSKGASQDASIQDASIVVINYNSLRFLDELFASIRDQTLAPREIFLVDNASSDRSVEVARDLCPELKIIRFEENRGFAAAANAGLEASNCEATAILNTDIKLENRWLEELLKSLSSGTDVAAVASKVMLYEKPGHINGVGGAMNRLGYTWDIGMYEEDRGQYDDPAEVIFAPASAALFRKSAVLDSGGFDESFFMYHEDVDLGWRLWLLGYRVLTCPGAVAHHHFGGSTKASRSMHWRELLGERNDITSLLKNYEMKNVLASIAEMIALRQSPSRKMAQLKNLCWNIGKLPRTLRKRRIIQKRRNLSDDEISRLIVQSSHVPIRL